MRVILMYDLDFSQEDSQKIYTRFHKSIIRQGFIMMQYSVYMRVVNTQSKAEQLVNRIKKEIPKNGNIRIIFVTDAQYLNMKYLRGGKRINETINTNKRYVKINKQYE